MADVRPQVGRIAVRDSKDPEGPGRLFLPAQFAGFVDNVRAGACDA